jgi:hypothetical protein
MARRAEGPDHGIPGPDHGIPDPDNQEVMATGIFSIDISPGDILVHGKLGARAALR